MTDRDIALLNIMNDDENIYDLTQVSLVTNVDGIHTTKKVIGYISEHPFVVLTNWITKYYISTYYTELYPVNHTSIKYSLAIESPGNKYTCNNFTKNAYSNIIPFETIEYDLLHRAEAHLTLDTGQEYLTILGTIKDSTPAIQKAIDLEETITEVDSISTTHDSVSQTILKLRNVIGLIKRYTTPKYLEDFETLILISWILKQSAEKYVLELRKILANELAE